MSSQIEQWTQFVARLTEHTRAGKVVWQPAQLQWSPYGVLVGTAYQASVEGKAIGLHEYSETTYNPDPTENHWPASMEFKSVALGVLDSKGEFVWRVPVEPRELLDQVRYQASGAGLLLEGFLRAKSA